jgi:hypothetical protein
VRAKEVIGEDRSLRGARSRSANAVQANDSFEMADFGSDETGLPFAVWTSPRNASHAARIKVTNPPWGSNPEAVYTIEPFQFAGGWNWLSAQQTEDLSSWVRLNAKALMDFWDGRIPYDRQLRKRLVAIGDAPPTDHEAAVIGLRASASKVGSIRWFRGAYHLTFDRHLPTLEKVSDRFAELGFTQPIRLHRAEPNEGIVLWPIPK